MGRAKRHSFRPRQNRIADLAKALAHPARIAILELLAARNECVCGDIVSELPLSQATVSQHLAQLKRAGLITGEFKGPRVCYCINSKAWNEAQNLIGTFLEKKQSCC